jgi:hypothetical protein
VRQGELDHPLDHILPDRDDHAVGRDEAALVRALHERPEVGDLPGQVGFQIKDALGRSLAASGGDRAREDTQDQGEKRPASPFLWLGEYQAASPSARSVYSRRAKTPLPAILARPTSAESEGRRRLPDQR